MQRRLALVLLAVFSTSALVLAGGQSATARHFPARGAWETRDPAALGLDKAKLGAAIAEAMKRENQNTRDLAVDIPNTFRNEAPYNNLIGPTQVRAGGNGVVVYKGYAVASWGETERADMTFSVTKTFLSTTVGVLYDRKLIKDVNDRVAPYMPAGVDLFTSEHNAKIRWDHLLRQTSDWYGVLWTKPDWADRPPRGVPVEEWSKRALNEPGTFFKYNDTRVNVLALAALHVVKRPLPEVLKESIMDPIGASNTWHWEGYDNAWVEIDGKKMKSMTGGGHFGGGMFISAWDMARFGYLFLNNGKWRNRQLISEKWIGMARTPGPANAGYGYMNWYFNASRPGRVTFQGNGPNTIYIDWNNDLVIVTRWIQGGNTFFDQVVGAIQSKIGD
jgi:CubicO group peptidase (beta-lactamase class C family)